jgi:hypothetical protein
MARRREQRALVGVFDNPAEVHDGDTRRDMPNDGEIMRNEDVREAEALLEIAKQVDHLRLDRDIEGRDRFVAYDEARLDRQRPRDADALPLAA